MAKKSLIIGGAGSLGRSVVNVFKSKGWQVLSVDLVDSEKADANIRLNPNEKMTP